METQTASKNGKNGKNGLFARKAGMSDFMALLEANDLDVTELVANAKEQFEAEVEEGSQLEREGTEGVAQAHVDHAEAIRQANIKRDQAVSANNRKIANGKAQVKKFSAKLASVMKFA